MNRNLPEGPSEKSDAVSTQDEVLTRLSRRIRGSIANPARPTPGPYLLSRTEAFWDRHLYDLVNDSFALGVARSQGLAPIGEILHRAFESLSPLLQGYVALGAHANNLALTDYRPPSELRAAKVNALVQLHARSLVLLDEVFALIYSGFPSGAEAISRTLYEVAVTARFLARFKAELSQRYLASHIVELWRSKSELIPQRGAAQTKDWRALEEELDARYAAVVKKHGTSITYTNGWASPRFQSRTDCHVKPLKRVPFSKIQEAVGDHRQLGRYRANSHHVHAVHLGTIKTLVHNKPETLTLGPRPYGFAGTAVDAIRDAQATTEALLRTCGRQADGAEIFYWLEAMDQISYVLCEMVTSVDFSLGKVFQPPAGRET